MPIQPFLHEPFHNRGDGRLVGKGCLIFDDDMGNSGGVRIGEVVSPF